MSVDPQIQALLDRGTGIPALSALCVVCFKIIRLSTKSWRGIVTLVDISIDGAFWCGVDVSGSDH